MARVRHKDSSADRRDWWIDHRDSLSRRRRGCSGHMGPNPVEKDIPAQCHRGWSCPWALWPCLDTASQLDSFVGLRRKGCWDRMRLVVRGTTRVELPVGRERLVGQACQVVQARPMAQNPACQVHPFASAAGLACRGSRGG